MLEEAAGRLIKGALWGLGAGVVIRVMQGTENEGKRVGSALRPATKSVMKAYLVVSERALAMAAEARESVEDLYAEVRAEREAELHTVEAGGQDQPNGRRRRARQEPPAQEIPVSRESGSESESASERP